GDVCLGTFKDLNLTINNSGGCTLMVNAISSSSGQFLVPAVMSYPLVIQAGGSLVVPIRFQPTGLRMQMAVLTITSNDPLWRKQLSISGNVPPGAIRVTGSTAFGDVCGAAGAEKSISICNVGECNLAISSVAFAGSCPNFALVNNPFPAVVSPDSC